MTTEEHALIVGILARQLQLFKTLTTILKSRGVLEQGDIGAFGSLVHEDTELTKEILDQATYLHHSIAGPLGIRTGLEQPPKSP